jgi:hypothetical protein
MECQQGERHTSTLVLTWCLFTTRSRTAVSENEKESEMKALSTLVAALALLVAASPDAADAADYLSPQLSCPEYTGTAMIDVTPLGSARQSLFWVRFNRGQWVRTAWWYTNNYQRLRYDEDLRRWVGVSYTAIPLFVQVGNRVFVEAMEWRVMNGVGSWQNLGSCTTSEFTYGGIVPYNP